MAVIGSGTFSDTKKEQLYTLRFSSARVLDLIESIDFVVVI